MKKILLAIFVFIFVLTSCTKDEEKVIVDTLTRDENTRSVVDASLTGSLDMMAPPDVLPPDTSTTGTSNATLEIIPSVTAGGYSEYNSSLVGASEKTVLFFHAPWCPTCVAADKAIQAGTLPAGVAILKVDYDSSDELRKKYLVTYQHTFVQVDADGAMVKKWSGGTTIDDILEPIK